MNEQSVNAELGGNAAQLDGEPLRRFGPAVRLTAGSRSRLGIVNIGVILERIRSCSPIFAEA
jgi:hypothetical protein